MSTLRFKEHAFADKVSTLMLVYKKQSMQMQEFSQMLQYLVTTYSTDIIARDFNYNTLKVSENNFSDISQTMSRW